VPTSTPLPVKTEHEFERRLRLEDSELERPTSRQIANRRAETAMTQSQVFEDRRDAGRRLSRALEPYRGADPIVLGLPRGGVVVAYEVAERLEAPLDVVVVRKLGHPQQPELAVGAIGPGGVLVLDRQHGIRERDVKRTQARERAEMERRIRTYRGSDGVPDLEGRVALLVDDGLATGLTAEAAIRATRQAGAQRIVLAVPVAAPEAAERIEQQVDDFVCLSRPDAFFAIGGFYVHFAPVTDQEVIAYLERARRNHPADAPEERG
jgi:putative phosphoribosyl transferase